ncbi:MAG: hypothetical protein OHK0039_04260 [Bacteroidia bacterium]
MNKLAETVLPTRWGIFRMIAYQNKLEDMPHLALVSGAIEGDIPVIVRIHSECMTGDVFGSVRCDCGEQLEAALRRIAQDGGVLLYLRQEGRGIGLVNKMHAYNLQDQGFNTADANTQLGFGVDERAFDIAVFMLQDLGVRRIRLLTNNPEKIAAFDKADVVVEERLPLSIPPREENLHYLQTKRLLMGHILDLPANGSAHH